MCIDQGKMEFNLLFCQWRFHISYTQTFWKDPRLVQFINKRMIIHRAFYIAHLFIISKCKQRFRLNRHVTILYPSPIIALVLTFLFGIVGNYYLPIVIHILIRLFTCLAFILLIIILLVLIILCHIIFRNAILTIQLRFHYLKLIRLGSFTVSNFFTRFSTLVITGQEVRILVDHSRIVFYRPTIISGLRT